MSRRSVVPAGPHSNQSGYTGPPKEYDASVMQMGYRIVSDPEALKEIRKRFDTIKDKDGRSMTEVCKAYWERKKRAG